MLDSNHRAGGPAEIWLAYNEAENMRDSETLRALVSPSLSATVNGSTAVSSAEEDDAAMQRIFELYPDYRRDALEVLEINNRVIARWRMLGTSINPSSVPNLDISGCSIVKVDDGVMSEAMLYCNDSLLSRIASGEVE